MWTDSFWSSVVFEKEVISYSNVKRLQAWSLLFLPESTQICTAWVFFLSSFSCNFNGQLNPNLHKFVMLCICWDTPSENTGLWQLPNVSSAFKQIILLNIFFLLNKTKQDTSYILYMKMVFSILFNSIIYLSIKTCFIWYPYSS